MVFVGGCMELNEEVKTPEGEKGCRTSVACMEIWLVGLGERMVVSSSFSFFFFVFFFFFGSTSQKDPTPFDGKEFQDHVVEKEYAQVEGGTGWRRKDCH
jgi:hypothetical protein